MIKQKILSIIIEATQIYFLILMVESVQIDWHLNTRR